MLKRLKRADLDVELLPLLQIRHRALKQFATAAEHLAAVFKGTKRATLIGETTAGAGHYGGTAPLGGGYSAFIPVGRSYFPGGESWEQVGVKPDIAVAPERALVEALTREGVPASQAEALSASHMPKSSMERRKR